MLVHSALPNVNRYNFRWLWLINKSIMRYLSIIKTKVSWTPNQFSIRMISEGLSDTEDIREINWFLKYIKIENYHNKVY